MKKVHHKPTFGGTSTGATLSNSATPVTGQLTASVRNGNSDEHFRPGVFATAHGTITVDRTGHWSYVLNTVDAAVSGLATSAILTDTILVHSKYSYRNHKGTNVVITITGA